MARQRIAVFRFRDRKPRRGNKMGTNQWSKDWKFLFLVPSQLILCCLQKAGEVAQQLRELSALARIKSSIPSTHIT